MIMIRLLERVLLATGVICLGWYGIGRVEALQARRVVEAALEPPPPSSGASAIGGDDRAVGLLEIPRLGLSTPVLVGDDDATLRAAAGHLPDTPRPWQGGNTAIAGHRDGVFRALRGIRVGDRIRMVTPRGDFDYEVRATTVVAPDDLSVLKSGDTAMLTLITCFPFTYIGPAPHRFIVQADRIR